jgi:1,2-diacylglycerol 3-alpha-glucosyltransferase
MYEEYTHYVPLQSPALKKFAVELSTGYANLADVVFAPSESVARCIRARGVRSRVAVVPTGVETAAFSHGDGADVRARFKIPPDAFVIGHLGRLAAEKNLEFLVRAVTDAMHRRGTIHFLLVGGCPFSDRIREQFRRRRLGSRLHLTGVLEGEEVADAYAAMDIFAFSSKSETQGLVVAEAMAAGVPVVALDAPGAREVVKDGVNGRLLSEEDEKVFAEALLWAARRPSGFRKRLQRAARATAARFSMEKCARRALRFYEALRKKKLLVRRNLSESVWENARRWFEAEWELVSNMADAATAAFERRETPGLR